MPIGFRCNNCITIHSYIPKQSQKNIKGSFLLCSYHQSPDASSACFVVHVPNVIGHNLSFTSLLKKYHELL